MASQFSVHHVYHARQASPLRISQYAVACRRAARRNCSNRMQRREPTVARSGDAGHRGVRRQLDLGPRASSRADLPCPASTADCSEGRDYRVINAGVTGDTSSRSAASVRRALVPDTRIVILAIGGQRRSARRAGRNGRTQHLDDDRAGAGARHPTCCCVRWRRRLSEGSTTPSSFIASSPGWPSATRCRSCRFSCSESSETTTSTSTTRLHPNAAGHKVIADTIWPHLRPML